MGFTMLKQKIAAVFTAILTAFSAVGSPLPSLHISAADTHTGDVNRDGTVNTADILLLQKYLSSAASLTTAQKKAGDMDGNDSLNVLDLSLLKSNLLRTIGDEKYGGLMINEVCSSSKESVTDAAGASPDWIEIYNSSDKAMRLDGIGISDGAKNKFKFVFPTGTVIRSGGYILIYCDDAVNQAKGEHHAAFKISATGETIYLTHPQYGEIDSVAVPELDTDVCYGRYANGSESFTYLSYTPGKSNDGATDLKLVEKPLFSAEGGFYDEAFMLTLSDQNGNEIYYTTDGSDPRTSDTARLYSSAINIYNNTSAPNVLSAVKDISLYNHVYGQTMPSGFVEKGIVVRAVSKTSDGRFSPVATNGYYIGKSASYYNEMKVISMSTDFANLFDEDTGAYMVGSGYYEWKNSSEYSEMDPGDVNNPTNYNKDGIESEFPVNIQVYENGRLAYTADMGARISGNWTRAARQKSFRLYARSEYGDSKMKYAFFNELTDINGELIEKFDKVTIRNAGNDNEYLHFRDALVQDLVSDLSPDTMASEPCILFIDGEFWGFYMLREKIDADYIESHYGIDKNDAAVIKNGELEDGLESDLTELRDFCSWAATADMSSETNYQKLCNIMDIQSFMDYMAVETYVNNADWIAETYINNWQVWRSNAVYAGVPESDGKWRFIFYDLDMSLGIYQNADTIYSYDSLGTIMTYPYKDYDWAAVLKSLMKNPDFAQQFYDNYIHIIETCFAPNIANAKLTEYANAYSEATNDTFMRFGAEWAANDYDNQVALARSFLSNRPAYAKRYLDAFYAAYGPGSDYETDSSNLLPDVSQWTYYGTAQFSADSLDHSFTAETPAVGAQLWDIQSQANGISLKTGKTYMLTFEASCTTPTNMTMGIIRYENGEYPGCWYGEADLTNQPEEFTYVFTMDEVTSSDWFLYFNYAGAAGKFTIQNARLTEVQNLVSTPSVWSYYNPDGKSTLDVIDANNLVFDVTVLPEYTYDVQAGYGGISIKAGETYTYSFTVQSTAKTQIKAKIQQNYESYVNYSNVFAETGSEAATYTVTFTAEEDCPDAKISFNCGYAVGTYNISDIVFVCHN